MTVLLFCFIVTLALLSGSAVFAGFGSAICTFMYGTFGYGCFLVMAAAAYLGVWLVFEKSIKIKLRPALLTALTVYALFLLFHAVSTRTFELDGNYIARCYDVAEEGFPAYTFGGVLSAILVYPVALLTTFVGAYIIFAAICCLVGAYTVKSYIKHYKKGTAPVAVQAGARHAEAQEAMRGAAAEEAYAGDGYPYGGNAPVYEGAQGAFGDGQYVQQPYDNRYVDGQYGQYGAYPQPAQAEDVPAYNGGNGGQWDYPGQKNFVEPYFTTQRMVGQSVEEDKFSPEKLGRKILFERDEFAAESYRRNGIFDENSYFNHPVSNSGDYMRGFSDGKSKKATTVEPATYSEAYRRSVDSEQAPQTGMVYGDAPAQKLSDEEAVQDVEAENTAAYTAPDSGDGREQPFVQEGPMMSDADDIDFGAPETDIDDSAELDSGREEEGEVFSSSADAAARPSTDADEVFPSSRFASRRIDDAVFPSREGEDDRLFRSEREDISRGRDGFVSRRDDAADSGSVPSAFNDVSREFTRGHDVPQDESGRTADIGRRGSPYALEPDRDSPSRTDRLSDGITDRGDGINELGENRRIAGFGDAADVARGSQQDDAPSGTSNDISSIFSASNSRLGENRIEPDMSRLSGGRDKSKAGLFDDDGADDEDDAPIFGGRRGDGPSLSGMPAATEQPVREPLVPAAKVPVPEKPAEEKKPPHVWKKYVRPSLDLLEDYPEQNASDSMDVEESKRIIVETLEGFKIECEVSDVVVGPAITRFDVIIKDRTNIKASLRYRESIAMALKKENVNAYLNYSKGALSIEVPNSHRSVVGLKGMMLSSSFKNAKVNSLTFALGKNVEGTCICPDITKMPHLLVAGTTGSGKSICLSSLLISLLYKYGPEELRFILVDPKQVEFISYDKLPHLMINEIIYDVDKAIKALNWAIKEMERRYTLFKDMTETGENAKGHIKVATKDVNEYNSHLEDGLEKLPKIVIVLDEFGDLMLQAKKDIESRIIKLVQKARAAGIHLILATQRPSVDCITGLIKSNLPTRIGFKVGSFDDSRTIFDVGGAEKLLGKGDMYFRSAERPDLMRIQGCFVDTPEVQRVTDFIKEHNETYFDQSVSDFINTVEEPEQSGSLAEGADSPEETKIDDTFIRALKYCVMQNAASVSMIQRRFPIGYIKACKIVDWMENMNYITKSEGSKSRKVLLSQEEFFNTYGDVDD